MRLMAQEQDIEDNKGKVLLQGLWDTLSQRLVWKGRELRVEGRLQDCMEGLPDQQGCY